jgi:hypothetical protein
LQTQETDWAEDAEGVDEELDDDILDLREISRNKKVVTSLKGLPGHNIDTDEPLSDESSNELKLKYWFLTNVERMFDIG